VTGSVRAAVANMGEDDEILAANATYYRAFANGDFAAMSRIWAPEQVSCVHPGWPVLVGRAAVLESWQGILGNLAPERIVFHEATAMVAGDEGRVLCIEVIGTVAFAASNWFRRIDGIWRMIHHHASPIALQVDDDAPEPGSRRLN
jgi:ketosteroid isomerase-like protein